VSKGGGGPAGHRNRAACQRVRHRLQLMNVQGVEQALRAQVVGAYANTSGSIQLIRCHSCLLPPNTYPTVAMEHVMKGMARKLQHVWQRSTSTTGSYHATGAAHRSAAVSRMLYSQCHSRAATQTIKASQAHHNISPSFPSVTIHTFWEVSLSTHA